MTNGKAPYLLSASHTESKAFAAGDAGCLSIQTRADTCLLQTARLRQWLMLGIVSHVSLASSTQVHSCAVISCVGISQSLVIGPRAQEDRH